MTIVQDVMFSDITLREGAICVEVQFGDIEFEIRHVVGSDEVSLITDISDIGSITQAMLIEATKGIEKNTDHYLLKVWEVDPEWFPTPLADGPETVWVRHSPMSLPSRQQQTRFSTYGDAVRNYYAHIIRRG